MLMADFTLSGDQLLLTDTATSPTSPVETGGIPTEITGTVYYVSNNGDDSNNGTSESTPWKTIAKVTGSNLNPGDGILFKRGDTWVLSNSISPKIGTSSAYVVYGAYGTGEKPILTAAIDKNSVNDWTEYSTNKWQTSMPGSEKRMSHISVNGKASSQLVYGNNIAGLTAQGEHCHNESTGVTTIYSVGNPANYYSDIKVVPRIEAFSLHGKSWFIIDGLHLTHLHFGMYGANVYNFKIRNNEISWIGGSIFAGQEKRYGNGIEIWGNQGNGEIYFNKIWQCYDAGVTSQFQDVGSSHMSNISVHHNIFYQNGAAYEYFNRSDDGSSTNMRIENNVMFDAGGWKKQQAGSEEFWGHHIALWSKRTNSVPHNGFYIRNNIMWKNYNNGSDIYGGWTGSDFTVVNNTFSTSSIFSDASNLIGDPLFVSESSFDFHLKNGSPAIGNGLDLGYTKDFDGIDITPSNNSIGAYTAP